MKQARTQLVENVGARPPKLLTRWLASPAERSETRSKRLELLYEITRLLARFESVDRTLAEVASVTSEGLSIQSFVLTMGPTSKPRTVAWGTTEGEGLARQTERAQRFFDYLVGGKTRRETGLAMLGQRGVEVDLCHYVVLPVASEAGTLGVLQVERTSPLDENDLAFLDAVASEIAVALERADEAERLAESYREAVAARVEAEQRRSEIQAAAWSNEWLQGHYESLLDHLDRAFVWEANADTLSACYVSAGVEAVLGYSPKDCLGEAFYLRAVHEDDRADVEKKLRDAWLLQQDRRFLHRSVDAHGAVRWLRTGVRLDTTSSPQARVVGVTVDVTELQAERSLLESEIDLSRALTARVTEGVVAVDHELKITFMNRTAASLLDVSADEAPGRPLSTVLQVRRADGCVLHPNRCPLVRAARGGESNEGDESLFMPRTGTPFLAGYAASPILGRTGVTGAVLAFRNILEGKRAERMQRFLAEVSGGLGSSLEHRATLSTVAHMSVPFFADACFIDEVGVDGSMTRSEVAFANATKQHLASGLRASVPRGSPQMRVLESGEALLFDDLSDVVLDEITRDEKLAVVLRGIRGPSMLLVPLSSSGRKLGVITFITGESGRKYTVGDVEFAKSLADRAAMAIENATLFASAQDAVKKRQDILALVSHDLRAPLNSIVMSAGSLVDASAPLAQRGAMQKSVDIIQRSVKRMERMLKDLLDISSIDAGKLSVRLAPVQVSALIEDAKELVEHIAHQGTIHLEWDIPDADTDVLCDHERILQVLSNLIGNALKYGRAGDQVVVRSRRRRNEIVFEVDDTGPGIPTEQLPHLFERSWRGSTTASGNGLGLFIVKGILGSHGSDISVESEVGRGTRFSFTLGLAPRDRPSDPVEDDAPVRREGLLVMVVDQEAIMRTALDAILQSWGHEVLTHSNAFDALAALESGEPPDLVLIDLSMPIMDGWGLHAEMRRLRSLASVPVVFTSSDLETKQSVLDAGAEFLAKPIGPEDLLEVVARYARR